MVVAAQASKEFHQMCEPKIVKFKGGYSADTELSFHSWHMDILAHISNHELDNNVAIHLIKDHTLDRFNELIDLCDGSK